MGKPVLQQIDSLVAARLPSQHVYARGLIAVDEMARRAHGRTFAGLAEIERTEILSAMESLHRTWVDPSRSGLRRKLSHAWGMWSGASAAAELYERIVSDTQQVFYSSEMAWLWLEYDGPPMPLGYESSRRIGNRAGYRVCRRRLPARPASRRIRPGAPTSS
jgi:hypothetical protein